MAQWIPRTYSSVARIKVFKAFPVNLPTDLPEEILKPDSVDRYSSTTQLKVIHALLDNTNVTSVEV
jgi:hypothetical protein